ncbi:MAG TPA: APC family permease [Solirubrobacteraceae bacterium]|nr:APC family permease [Solirubrobacteraceae bacterium]
MAGAVQERPASSSEAKLDSDGLDRGVGFLGLLWASEGSLIGSGWLFGALSAGVIAGPSAIIAWLIASVIVIVLALVHAELAGLFPVTGGTSRFPFYSFGTFAGATFGWASYLQAATVAPIEVLAAIQYLATAHWAKGFYVSHGSGTGTLSGGGIVAAIILMVIFVIINLVGIRWLARVNNGLTSWKVFIPVLTIIILAATHFHASNFTDGGGFFVKNHPLKAILIAIPAGGIVFSLLGFEQAVQLGGEARDPKQLPRAVILSILIGAAVYVLLQVVFIGAMDPHLLASQGGWLGLGPKNSNPTVVALNAGPFYTITKIAGLSWLAFILRLDAIISPSGTGLIYLTTASRISFGLTRNGFLPTAFERTNQRTKVPVIGVIVTTIIGLLFLLPFPSWASLVNVVTSSSVLMYAGAPLALAALRRQKPDLPRLYRLPAAGFLAPASFAAASLIVFWAGWQTYTTLMVAMLIGYAFVWATHTFHLNPKRPPMDWGAAVWIIPYFIGMGIISYFGLGTGGEAGGIIGSIGVFKTVLVGGKDQLGVIGSLIVTVAFSLVIYYVAVSRRLPEEKVDEYVADVYPPPVAE